MGKTAKVVICGMKSVGKTAILEQVIYGGVSTKTVFDINIILKFLLIYCINLFIGTVSNN